MLVGKNSDHVLQIFPSKGAFSSNCFFHNDIMLQKLTYFMHLWICITLCALKLHWGCYIFSLYGWIFLPVFYSNPPHMYMDSGSRVGCHLNCAPWPYLCKALMKEPCLFFLQVWTLHWRSYVLNKIIVSPVLSRPLVAKQPRLPESHSSSLCTDTERHLRLHPERLQISRCDTTYLLLTQLLINNLEAFAPHTLLWVVAIYDASPLDLVQVMNPCIIFHNDVSPFTYCAFHLFILLLYDITKQHISRIIIQLPDEVGVKPPPSLENTFVYSIMSWCEMSLSVFAACRRGNALYQGRFNRPQWIFKRVL